MRFVFIETKNMWNFGVFCSALNIIKQEPWNIARDSLRNIRFLRLCIISLLESLQMILLNWLDPSWIWNCGRRVGTQAWASTIYLFPRFIFIERFMADRMLFRKKVFYTKFIWNHNHALQDTNFFLAGDSFLIYDIY